ncbi:MAG TPA: YdcF family protein [Gammaproteobacteria bacterium]|nr:YdcF family protein [Gammaproteobacteria bacterium]
MLELYITNFIKHLIFPPGIIWVLLLLALLTAQCKPRFSRSVLKLSLISGYALSLPLTSDLLTQSLQIYPALTEQQLHNTDAGAIVVLSSEKYKNAPEYQGDTIGNTSLVRIRYGAYIHRLTDLPILVSGGHVFDRDGSSLAQVMAQSLQDDFQIKNVWLEEQSRTTAENATLSQAFLKKKQINKILLVTNAYHMPRAVNIFEKTGLEVIPAPTKFATGSEPWYLKILPSASALKSNYIALHEWLGRAWYAIRY